MRLTIQTGRVADGDEKQDFMCRAKYCNTLPDIPFDSKFIKYPFLSNRFLEYETTSLGLSYKQDLPSEHDLGITIDLINPYTYAPDSKAVLISDDDERLLMEDTLTSQDSKKARHYNKIAPWLKKTEYTSNEFNRYGQSSKLSVTQVRHNVKKLFKEENMYMDRENQISAINKTFADAKIPIEKHYSKPGVFPVDVCSVFPDFDLWRYPFSQVMFDSNPVPPTQMEEMSQGMIRGAVDKSGKQCVAYFLPTEETSKKRKREPEENADDEEFEYKMIREYDWNVKSKASKGYEANYFFVFRDNGIYYNELETKVELSKRRAKANMPTNNSILVVKHRQYNEIELNHQNSRMSQLQTPILEDESETESGTEKDEDKYDEEHEETKNDNETESEEETESKSEQSSGSAKSSFSESEDQQKKGC